MCSDRSPHWYAGCPYVSSSSLPLGTGSSNSKKRKKQSRWYRVVFFFNITWSASVKRFASNVANEKVDTLVKREESSWMWWRRTWGGFMGTRWMLKRGSDGGDLMCCLKNCSRYLISLADWVLQKYFQDQPQICSQTEIWNLSQSFQHIYTLVLMTIFRYLYHALDVLA